MKKILLTILFASGLAALAPTAQAHDGCETVFVGYDRCGRPVYSQVERHEYYRDYGYERHPVHYRHVRYDDDRCERPRFFPRPGAAFTFFFRP